MDLVSVQNNIQAIFHGISGVQQIFGAEITFYHSSGRYNWYARFSTESDSARSGTGVKVLRGLRHHACFWTSLRRFAEFANDKTRIAMSRGNRVNTRPNNSSPRTAFDIGCGVL
jgi:hypothetical protein